jgi:hypothetical protein
MQTQAGHAGKILKNKNYVIFTLARKSYRLWRGGGSGIWKLREARGNVEG